MLYTSVDKLTVSNQVYKFMCNLYPNLEKVDIEVIPTDLTEDNVFGWCLENNNQFEIEIHDKLGYNPDINSKIWFPRVVYLLLVIINIRL